MVSILHFYYSKNYIFSDSILKIVHFYIHDMGEQAILERLSINPHAQDLLKRGETLLHGVDSHTGKDILSQVNLLVLLILIFFVDFL